MSVSIVSLLIKIAHLSPGHAQKSLAWALGDATDAFPNEDPGMGAIVLNNKVIVDGVDIVSARTAIETMCL